MEITYRGETTVVAIKKETPKAILLEGNASEAWFPKKSINEFGEIAEWFTMGVEHSFLWFAPKK